MSNHRNRKSFPVDLIYLMTDLESIEYMLCYQLYVNDHIQGKGSLSIYCLLHGGTVSFKKIYSFVSLCSRYPKQYIETGNGYSIRCLLRLYTKPCKKGRFFDSYVKWLISYWLAYLWNAQQDITSML